MEPEESASRPVSAHHGAPHKNTRREAREMVLRMLFQIDIGNQPAEDVIETSLDQSVLEGNNREFAAELVRGTLLNLPEIDSKLRDLTQDWALERQAAVDRNILRMTTFEILFRPDTPVAAVINEAVELAKKYSTAESGRFVNGVLGAMARTVSRGQNLDLIDDASFDDIYHAEEQQEEPALENDPIDIDDEETI